MRVISTIVLSFLFFISYSQKWKYVDDQITSDLIGLDREIIPAEYATLKLDIADLNQQLLNAPAENLRNGSVIIDLPMPEGRFEKFEIVQSPIMMPGLAAKYPFIKSYRAYSLENESTKARITMGNRGLSASILTPNGDVYIDPYAIGQTEYYLSYYIKNHEVDDNNVLGCGATNSTTQSNVDQDFLNDLQVSMRSTAENINLRRYRMAIACTGEWGANNGMNSVASALELIVSALDKANLIYENELSIIYMLVDDNDQLIQLDAANDPYDVSDNAAGLIGQNTGVVNAIIGGDSYDIGHIFHRFCNVGGIASLGSLCAPNKASGATCWFNSTTANNGIIGTFAHEMGHQMNANHTMNHCDDENENPSTGWEVGSGSTIMSYSGGCGQFNTGNSYDHYHVGNIQEMYLHTRNNGPGDCAVKEDIGNHAPEASHDYVNGFYIPISTPFILDADAYDCDDDPMTYSWEQFDVGPIYNPGSPVANVPIFEALNQTTETRRYFPKILTVYANSVDNFELLPTYSRNLTFRFTVRDNHPGGGTIDWAEVDFEVTDEAGPFRVEYPNVPETFEVGQEITVEWDVANTDGDLVDCQFVDIYISTSPGQPWDDNLVVSQVPNDGSQNIIIPNNVYPFVKFIVQANDNIFYDMSNFESEIVAPTSSSFFMDVFPKSQDLCLPNTANFTIEGAAFGGFSDMATYQVLSGLPAGAVANFSANTVNPDEDINLEIDLTGVSGSGSYPIVIEAIAGTTTLTREVTLNITGTDFSSLDVVSPSANEAGVGDAPTLEWVDVPDAIRYDVQLATSPSFDPMTIFLDVEGVGTNQYTLTNLLEKNTLYYWRVRAHNDCAGGEFTETRAFGTATLNCNIGVSTNIPLNISQSGTPSIEATIPVTSTGSVVDVSVTRLKGLHDKVSDLAGFLISPAGTEITLWEEKCSNSSNYNLGFNDAAPTEVVCPINTGNSFKPVTPLSTLANEDAQGIWKIRIEDRDPGNGGTLDEASIEICSNAALDPPSLINNNTLELPPATGQLFLTTNLLTEDPDNPSEELVYTVVSATAEGDLYLDATALTVGSFFTQKDINDGKMRYRHDAASTAETDSFTFTVNDGNGGWIGITTFNIAIDESFVSSVKDIDDIDFISIYPNPAKNEVFIDLLEWDGSEFELSIYSLDGKLVQNRVIQSNNVSIDVQNLNSGLYLFELSNNNERYQKRIFRQK